MAKILYVEEEGVAGCLQARLGVDHEVVLVSTIAEAEEATMKDQFDLVLVEPVLPAASRSYYLFAEVESDEFAGPAFLRELLSQPHHPPVIIASGWLSFDDELRTRVVRVFTKPYDNDELVKVVEETLAG